jgi:hypothetical protein
MNSSGRQPQDCPIDAGQQILAANLSARVLLNRDTVLQRERLLTRKLPGQVSRAAAEGASQFAFISKGLPVEKSDKFFHARQCIPLGKPVSITSRAFSLPGLGVAIGNACLGVHKLEIEQAVRLRRVQRIIDELCQGKQAEFAKRVGLSASYVSRMLSPAKKKGAKGIGERMARRIEIALGLPRLWLDYDESQGMTDTMLVAGFQAASPDGRFMMESIARRALDALEPRAKQ